MQDLFFFIKIFTSCNPELDYRKWMDVYIFTSIVIIDIKVKVRFICIAHFMYKTIQSALNKIKTLQRGAEEALKICKRI